MSVNIDLSGWVMAITGGSRGVGAGIVARFLEAGAVVESCGRTDPGEQPEGVHFFQADIRDPEQVQAWIDDIDARHGRLDVLINNAGGSPFSRFEQGSPRYQRAITELNFLSAASTMLAAYPLLRRKGGSVINITSISARRPSPGTAVYGAAKAALESLTTSLAVEWAPHIRVNAVSCGLVETESAVDHYGGPEDYARIAATIPRGRLAQPAEIGAACVMLASPLSSHITGAVLPVDGGGEWPAFLAYTPNADIMSRTEGVKS